MPILPRVLPALLTLALVAAGCGGGGGGSDLSSKSPQDILDEVGSALGKVRTYHVEATQTDASGDSRLSGDVTADGSVQFRMNLGGKRLQVIAVGGKTYLKADDAFWKEQGGAAGGRLARLLADRWVIAPEASGTSLRRSLDQLAPKNLGYCLTRTSGTVGKRGTDKVAGQEAVVLIDKGDKPGTSPGEMYVATSGPALPLRVVQTGPEKPGGTKDPRCDDGTSTTKASDVRLSDFDKPVKVSPPSNPLDLSTLSGSGSSSVS